jgi:hypothetical protein
MRLNLLASPPATAELPSATRYMGSTFFYSALAIAIAFGTWLRLDQFLDQILIDDEWHAIHQLVLSTPSQFMLSFGVADYSIPLTLWYWLQAKYIGLSELGMRLPMMVAGIATLATFPLALRRKVDDRMLVVFALFIASSPLLIIYSRLARPYAITLCLSFIAFWCLQQAVAKGNLVSKIAFGYAAISAFVLWMHPITGPFLVTPLIALWLQRFAHKNPSFSSAFSPAVSYRSLLALTLITGCLMAIAVLPPMLSNPAALAAKSGVDSVRLATLQGVWYAWLGTGSTAVVLVALTFAALGALTVWRASQIVRWAIWGLALTFMMILISRPAWIFHPLTLARYLLPALPILLLFIASGVVTCIDYVAAKMNVHRASRLQHGMLLIPMALLATWWITSPLSNQLRFPNSNTLHLVEQFDFRDADNVIAPFIKSLPVSPFWASLANNPPGSIKIAVAPFRFESFDWAAPAWESASKQRVIPAFLSGSCADWLCGETPRDERFKFRNAVHAADASALARSNVTYLAFFKATRFSSPSPLETLMPACESWLRTRYAVPAFEDASLIVWKIP